MWVDSVRGLGAMPTIRVRIPVAELRRASIGESEDAHTRVSGARQSLERHAQGSDPLLAEHARWALARLSAA